MPAPEIDYFAISPVLLVFGFGVVGTLVEAFVAPSTGALLRFG
jgi:hypothetical protein